MVELNKTYVGEVVDYSYDGLGIVKIDGFCLFVENAIKGETLEIEVTSLKKNVGFAKIKRIIKKSEYRITPSCPYYEKCGGCHLLHMTYEEQVHFKKNYVLNLINHNLDLNLEDISFIYPLKKYRYRNKLIIPFDYVDGKCIAGLYAKESHNIISNTDCLISNETSFKIINFIKDYLNEYKYFNNVRNVMVRNNHLGELMVVIISKERVEQDLADLLVENFKEIKSIINNLNPHNTNKVLGDKEYLMYGSLTLEDELLGNKYEISSKSFFQVNLDQTARLYTEAIDLANLNENARVIDAYSGIGSIGLSLARSVKEVLGIEIIEEAVVNANNNAKHNNITNAKFISGKAEDLIMNYLKDYDYLIVDPPRKGLDKAFVDAVINSDIDQLVYISCNPSTLVRDIKLLGFKLVDVTLCDMFVNTYHVETIALLKRN